MAAHYTPIDCQKAFPGSELNARRLRRCPSELSDAESPTPDLRRRRRVSGNPTKPKDIAGDGTRIPSPDRGIADARKGDGILR